jgi:hypothetical protein
VHTFWKLAAVAVVVLGITAVTSTLTTAYLTRVPVAAEPVSLVAPAVPETAAVRRAPIVRVAAPRPLPARMVSAPAADAAPAAAPAPATSTAAARGEVVTHEPVAATQESVVASPPASVEPTRAASTEPPAGPSTVAAPAPATTRAPAPAADCDAGGRTWKIAKPGLIGTAIGAGLGAAGGAVASGGKGAGQGAIIGGLAGAALGSGYGAYQTKNECGNILGGNQKISESGRKAPAADRGTPVVAEGRPADTRGVEAPLVPESSGRITVYSAR